jgi:hypothetical protein
MAGAGAGDAAIRQPAGDHRDAQASSVEVADDLLVGRERHTLVDVTAGSIVLEAIGDDPLGSAELWPLGWWEVGLAVVGEGEDALAGR